MGDGCHGVHFNFVDENGGERADLVVGPLEHYANVAGHGQSQIGFPIVQALSRPAVPCALVVGFPEDVNKEQDHRYRRRHTIGQAGPFDAHLEHENEYEVKCQVDDDAQHVDDHRGKRDFLSLQVFCLQSNDTCELYILYRYMSYIN